MIIMFRARNNKRMGEKNGQKLGRENLREVGKLYNLVTKGNNQYKIVLKT
jgi:hypothetical protein